MLTMPVINLSSRVRFHGYFGEWRVLVYRGPPRSLVIMIFNELARWECPLRLAPCPRTGCYTLCFALNENILS